MRNLLFSLAIMALVSAPALASWAAVPLEILVDEADLIVVGKVTKIQDGGFAQGNRKYDVAVVEITSIAKSLAGKPKEVLVAQPGMGIITSADIRFRPGQQGIWLLTKDPERNVYWAKHPSQFQDAKKQKELADLVEARSKVVGGKPVNGLVARAELLESPGNFQVRFSLKNVSEKPITVCDFVGNYPLQVQWTGPDGKALKSTHYKWLEAVRLAGVTKTDFVTIPPGGVRFFGPRGNEAGIGFQTQPSPNFNVAQVGQQRVTVSFDGTQDGKEFGVENVWMGTVTANEVAFVVK